MKSEQLTYTNQARTSGATRRGRGAASSSARYEYRRFRNAAPKPQQQPPNPKSAVIEGNADQGCLDDSLVEPTAGQNPNDKVSSTEGENKDASSAPLPRPSRRRICKYFATEKSCYFGESCRFLHIQQDENCKDPQPRLSPLNSVAKSARPVTKPNVVVLSKDDIGKQQQWDARNSEIKYLSRRFRDVKFAYDGNSYFIEFGYSITDPEWAFEIKTIRLKVKIPEEYPCAVLTVTLNEPNLPNPLVIYFDRIVKEFLDAKFHEAEEKNTYMCICKIFIRWLDHHIFELFLEGLRKTKIVVEAEHEGITLHAPEISDLSTQNRSSALESHKEELVSEASEKEAEAVSGEGVEQEDKVNDEATADSSSRIVTQDERLSKAASIGARVQWDNLSGNIATLTIVTMAISIKCAKCGALSFLTCTQKQLSSSHCQKCSNGYSIIVSPQLVHENSNVIAFLEPKGCIPVDCVLLSSKLAYTCLSCTKEAAIENLVYGAPHKSWCRSCHSRCEFQITAIRFVGNINSIAKEDSTLPKLKVRKKKVEQSVVLVEGQPLPDKGTCKHYKKSYRWFRFPCCGKLYPCDSCHDEAEKDHEMKLANRMVCGFCSKEQPFQKAKPCINCNENVTRVKSQFWEGGKGCRDQVLLSRNDTRKYTKSLLKTVSKKHSAELVVKKNAAQKE